ncbi:MAG: hypothetical protein GY805_23905 [Chloroflexi bacterium]|nr:hypothetical protein [Chloroflexota bacterium]
MLLKEQLKAEFDSLDERYLELLYKITRQFPRIAKRPQGAEQTRPVVMKRPFLSSVKLKCWAITN